MNPPVKPVAEIQFGIAWNWQYDTDFVLLLDHACHKVGLSSYLVGHHNLRAVTDDAEHDRLRFRWFLDRASDEDKHFLHLNQLLHNQGTRFLNAHHHYLRANDKAEIHRELLASGLHLPLTLILPPHDHEPGLDPALIDAFTKPFVVKPAKGGGGKGVLTGAMKLEDVTRTRSQQKGQRFLVQQHIEPQLLGGRRAWFRVYYVCDQVIPCWWDDRTHRYVEMTTADATLVNVTELERIARVIAHVAQLDFFSSEIALDRQGRYIVIDYVNTPCDMRLQSKYANGVPDAIVHQIVTTITGQVFAALR
jgi:glutathione synthase/RimK-type ligase-like ATP-grasp enzyme